MTSNSLSYAIQFILKLGTTKKLFSYFRQRYSREQIDYLNNVVKLKGKMRTLKWNMIFLQRCIGKKILPTFLHHRIQRTKVKPSWKIQYAFINDELENTSRRLNQLKAVYREDWNRDSQFLTLLDKVRLYKFFAEVELRMEA